MDTLTTIIVAVLAFVVIVLFTAMNLKMASSMQKHNDAQKPVEKDTSDKDK